MRWRDAQRRFAHVVPCNDRILATQAAISLENARLVGGLKQEIAVRRQAQFPASLSACRCTRRRAE